MALKPIPWTRTPTAFICPCCGRIDDSVVTGDQTHDIARGGCGQFVFSGNDIEVNHAKRQRQIVGKN